MFTTVSGVVFSPVLGQKDRLGNPVETFDKGTDVNGLLVSPSDTSDLDAERIFGDSTTLTVHFPKTWTSSLRGCRLQLFGAWAGVYRIIGDPVPYIADNTPGDWWLPVQVVEVDG